MLIIELGDVVRTSSGAIGPVRKITQALGKPTMYVVGPTARPVRNVTLARSRQLVEAERTMSDTERRVREWLPGAWVSRDLAHAGRCLDAADERGVDADDSLTAARARLAELLATLPKG